MPPGPRRCHRQGHRPGSLRGRTPTRRSRTRLGCEHSPRLRTVRVESIDAAAVLAMPGVLAVIDHDNAPRLSDAGDAELLILQNDQVHYRGQIVALVLAETLERARPQPRCRSTTPPPSPRRDVPLDHPELYAPGSCEPELPVGICRRRRRCRDRRGRHFRGRHLHDAGRTQQSDGTARNDGRSGRAATLTVVDSNQGRPYAAPLSQAVRAAARAGPGEGRARRRRLRRQGQRASSGGARLDGRHGDQAAGPG